jgi:hypothetical protein
LPEIVLMVSTGADVPQEQKATWGAFLKSLTHMTGDLSSMTAPPCELSSYILYTVRVQWINKAVARHQALRVTESRIDHYQMGHRIRPYRVEVEEFWN